LGSEVPAVLVTCTSQVPAASGGAMAVICVALLTAKYVASMPPKVTAVASAKPVPVTVTTVPPAVEPLKVDRPVTVGSAGALAVNWSALLVVDVPLGVVTVTSTVPAARAGAVASMASSDSTVKSVAAVVPKVTAVAPVKPLPSRTTVLPPSVLPVLGVMPVTAGAGDAL
jgi:hypothetical protein